LVFDKKIKNLKALICTEPGKFQYKKINAPELTTGHAIIKIKRIGICGTDLHAFEGTQPYFSYRRILGHELSGDLISSDNAQGFVPGEAVTIIPYFNCGKCIACRNNKPNCCASLKVFGVHIDGGMIEYISVPSYSLIHGEGLSYDELALIEPSAIGAHGIKRAAIKPGEYVLIIGAGPIGLGTMQFANIAGANVIAMDINEQRLLFCKQKLNVQHIINAKEKNVTEQLMEITNGDMPTVVIDCTGNVNAINNAFQYMAHSARFVLIGLQRNEIVFSHPEFHKREATLMSSRNATRGDFEFVIDCIKSGFINSADYITHHVNFDNLANEFFHFLNPASGVIKAMVEL
jgi:2-desacetyl-2-hydroxyethyl bacteriochlorophyllide A dehydrogenase